ncbi:DUF1131 family protein [Polymorphum gilvum]|uniref:Lipoprotein n=1 Tax=Polymorphum gilvum (strain LMG 25793 / CGMCC 1.9160 / SL003B-26A1) TaxID=991905 RepID=F2IV81_POLGS|nr:DUF1131 family protein [Polymorphum gilvum]ADZ71412.1 hypothetical protein SL003B_2989 [Polymorphum gilvum SL003B-26A1]
MRLPLVALSGLVLTFLGACSPTVDYDGPVTVARTSNVTLVQITRTGVGGITADTAYSAKAIQAALPGFTTDGIQTAVEDSTEWAIGAFNSDGFQVLQVFKGANGRIRTVHGVTHHLQGPNGERIGMTFAEVGTRRSDCRVGRNLWRGMAICTARGADNVELVYAIPQYTGPFDALPPDGELRGAAIQRILWSPAG